MEDDAGVRDLDEEESAEEKDQRLWDELFARAQGATARPLPTLSVVDGVVRIVAPGATFYERYAPYYRVRQQNDGGVDFIQMQCKLGCGSEWANVARSRPSPPRKEPEFAVTAEWLCDVRGASCLCV